MRWLLRALAVAFLGLGLIAIPVKAASPPPGSDNVTIWYGDSANVTANLTGAMTVTGLTASVEDIGDTIAGEIADISADWILFAFAFSLAFLGYIGHDRGMFLLSGFVFLVNGFTFWTSSFYMCVITVLAGIFLIGRAFTKKGIR